MGKFARGIRCLLQALCLILVLIGLSPVLFLAGVFAIIAYKGETEIKEETIADYI